MKARIISLLAFCNVTCSLLATSSMTSEEGPMKQKINFVGTLTSREQKRERKIDNISIDRMTRSINVLLVPTNKTYVKYNEAPNINRLKFPQDQMSGRQISLEEISKMEIPHPGVKWVYKKEEGYREVEYIEIIVSSKGAIKTKNRYLIERNRKIYYNDLDIPGFEEIHTPITAVKALTIDRYESGYKEKEEKTTQTSQAPIPEPQGSLIPGTLRDVVEIEEAQIKTNNF